MSIRLDYRNIGITRHKDDLVGFEIYGDLNNVYGNDLLAIASARWDQSLSAPVNGRKQVQVAWTNVASHLYPDEYAEVLRFADSLADTYLFEPFPWAATRLYEVST
jgi:hypothetical protein